MMEMNEVYEALRKAHAAGDTASAQKLAEYIQAQQSGPAPQVQSEAVAGDKSMIGALGGSIGQGVGNVALGAQNLVGSGLEKLGAESAGKWLQNDAAQGKARLKNQVQPYEQQYPGTAAAGKFVGEVAGTLPVGGVLGKALGAATKVFGAAGKAAPLIEALRTGGAIGGNLATRVAAGAITGGTSASIIDPESGTTGAMVGGAVPLAGPALKGVASLGKEYLGMTTGQGSEALKQALKAGRSGGTSGEKFADAMRGGGDINEPLQMAKNNLEAMARQRREAYKQNIIVTQSDRQILGFSGIDKALYDALGMASYKGQIKNKKAVQALQQAKEAIDNWKQLDPAEYHTPEGFDALKQNIGGILEGIGFEEKTARTAVGKVYDSIRSEITKQARSYAKTMNEYETASRTIKEIEDALSLGRRASADTSLRKLQSLMRNNVNTNYGARAKLADKMLAAGGEDFMPLLAGQSLSSWAPRGLQSVGAGAGSAALWHFGNPALAATVAGMSSPRLVGEAFYGAGRALGAADKVTGKVPPSVIEALRRGAYKAAPITTTE